MANRRQAVGISRLRHACLAEGKNGWKTNQDEKEGTGNAEYLQSIDILEVLNPCALGNNCSSSTACVCMLTGYVQPWSWAYPTCLGTFVSLSWVCAWGRCWSLAAAVFLSIGVQNTPPKPPQDLHLLESCVET